MEEKTIGYQELIDVVRSMKKEDEIFYFFLRACECGNLEVCQLCLDAGADINIYEHYWHQSLLDTLVRSRRFNTKAADWLIEKGANVNGFERKTTCTPLEFACYQGNFETAKYFIDKGAKIRQYKKDKCESALYNAVEGGNYKIVKLLIELGVDLETDVGEGENPFIRALDHQKNNIVELFLQRGVSPNFYTDEKRTPLHIATENQNVKAVQLLLKYGADVNAKVQEPSLYLRILGVEDLVITPMDLAVQRKNIAIQKILQKAGGCISSKEEKLEAIAEFSQYGRPKKEQISSLIKRVLAS